jgi:predicted S18 family serine protease
MDSLNRTIMLKNEGKNYSKELAYTIERSYSAESWSKFFGVKGKEFELNKEELKNSCISKLAEVEERFQYVQLFLPGALVDTKKEIEYATEDYAKGDYELCLFKASIAKAEVDVILGTMGVEEEHVNELLDAKLTVAKRVIVEEQEKGAFPILGYSYYEYANSLKDYDIYSALLYSEYALELSKLDMYFKEKRLFEMPHIDSRLILFLIGAAAGFLIGFGIFYTKKPKKKKAVKRGKSR